VTRPARKFARIPARWTERLIRSEISFDHYGVMTFIVSKADYRTRQAVFPSLKAMQDEMCWWRTGRHLRDVLRELRDEFGEIAFEKSQGSKDPYVFTIVPGDYFGRDLEQEGAAVLESGSDLEREGPNLEQTPPSSFQVAGGRSKSGRVANAHQQTDSDGANIAPVPSESPSTSTALRREDQLLGEGTREERNRENERENEMEKTDRLLSLLPSQIRRREEIQRAVAADERESWPVMVWPGPPTAGEEGVLADCDALVDAGLAEWEA
jgi:hypothetical protein